MHTHWKKIPIRTLVLSRPAVTINIRRLYKSKHFNYLFFFSLIELIIIKRRSRLFTFIFLFNRFVRQHNHHFMTTEFVFRSIITLMLNTFQCFSFFQRRVFTHCSLFCFFTTGPFLHMSKYMSLWVVFNFDFTKPVGIRHLHSNAFKSYSDRVNLFRFCDSIPNWKFKYIYARFTSGFHFFIRIFKPCSAGFSTLSFFSLLRTLLLVSSFFPSLNPLHAARSICFSPTNSITFARLHAWPVTTSTFTFN